MIKDVEIWIAHKRQRTEAVRLAANNELSTFQHQPIAIKLKCK
jgi:hypothetical protein